PAQPSGTDVRRNRQELDSARVQRIRRFSAGDTSARRLHRSRSPDCLKKRHRCPHEGESFRRTSTGKIRFEARFPCPRIMNAEKRRQIFERLAAAIPEPTTELTHSTPFELLIAVVLSA